MLERARAALARVDRRLDLWWDERKGLWKVMERWAQTGRWSYCLYWRGPDGEYRHPEPIEPLLEKLGEIDSDRYGGAEGHLAAIEAGHDARRRELAERKEAEREYLKKSVGQDFLERTVGVRHTFGPGTTGRRCYPKDQHPLRDAMRTLREAME